MYHPCTKFCENHLSNLILHNPSNRQTNDYENIIYLVEVTVKLTVYSCKLSSVSIAVV